MKLIRIMTQSLRLTVRKTLYRFKLYRVEKFDMKPPAVGRDIISNGDLMVRR
jgi:hypothetical protein